MEINSRHNNKVKFAASLKDKKSRDNLGLYLIEGIKSVKDAVRLKANITAIIGTSDLVNQYISFGYEVVPVTKDIADYISDSVTPQGIVAIAKIPDNRLIAPLSNAILLDGIQDPGNFGTIIRTAAALNISDIYTINCCDPYGPKAVRASMSGIFSVNFHTGDYNSVLNCLKDVPIISADMKGENLYAFSSPERFCLAIGSEGGGLSDEVKSASKYTVSIPMSDKMESLNAGVSASIILYQLIHSKGE